MQSINDLLCIIAIVLAVCAKYTCTVEDQSHIFHSPRQETDKSAANERMIDKNNQSSFDFDHNRNENKINERNNLNSSQAILIPLKNRADPDPAVTKTTPHNGTSEIALEGGDVIQQSSTALPNESGMMATDDNNHSTGSKPRKGVQFHGSKVVGRKGAPPVDPSGALHVNNTLIILDSSIHQSTVKDSPVSISNEKTIELNNTVMQNIKVEQNHSRGKDLLKITHSKKPEVVSDEGDVDDFDKYSIIKTSTTGEDYVIIGIVIVIGIWFSVFGALIFYRRAGEYWDRRHYRRMDFLVEGMYND